MATSSLPSAQSAVRAAAGASRAPELLDDPHWYALKTRARQEKTTHNRLHAAGVECFPAVARVEREWADRTRIVRMPLFPGYIFVRIELRMARKVLTCAGAVELVHIGGRPARLREEEFDAVSRLVQGVDETRTLPSRVDYLAPGSRVRVVEGAFRGMEGILLAEGGRDRVAVRLHALEQAAAVHVPRSLLSLLGSE